MLRYASFQLSLICFAGSGTLSTWKVWICDTSHDSYDIWLGLQVCPAQVTSICSRLDRFYLFNDIPQIAYAGCFLVWGAYVAFETKAVPSAYNESIHIMLALFVILFFGVILIPLQVLRPPVHLIALRFCLSALSVSLQYLVEDNPRALAVIRGVGQSLLALLLAVILFGPKLFYIV